MKIPENKWHWYGLPAHLCVSDYCRFHLVTEIGKYVVSTVGDYHPHNSQPDSKPEEIGWDRLYETQVFKWKGRCPCCGMPKVILEEIKMRGANDAKAARKNHMDLCYEVAE